MQQILYISTREKLETTKNQTTKEKQTTKTREKERKSPSPQNKIYHPEKREKREKAAVTGLKLAYQNFTTTRGYLQNFKDRTKRSFLFAFTRFN